MFSVACFLTVHEHLSRGCPAVTFHEVDAAPNARPPPRAMTRVCKTPIALVKKSIIHISFRCRIVIEGLRLSIRTCQRLHPALRLPVGVSCTVPCQRAFLLVGVGKIFVIRVLGHVVLVRKTGRTPRSCKIHFPPSITAISSCVISSLPHCQVVNSKKQAP